MYVSQCKLHKGSNTKYSVEAGSYSSNIPLSALNAEAVH